MNSNSHKSHKKAGREWAKRADKATLDKLCDLWENQWSKNGFLPGQAGQMVFASLFGLNDQNAAEAFWRSVAAVAVPDDEYVRGFVRGACDFRLGDEWRESQPHKVLASYFDGVDVGNIGQPFVKYIPWQWARNAGLTEAQMATHLADCEARQRKDFGCGGLKGRTWYPLEAVNALLVRLGKRPTVDPKDPCTVTTGHLLRRGWTKETISLCLGSGEKHKVEQVLAAERSEDFAREQERTNYRTTIQPAYPPTYAGYPIKDYISGRELENSGWSLREVGEPDLTANCQNWYAADRVASKRPPALTTAQLLSRGWTKTLIAKFLPTDNGSVDGCRGTQMPIYAADRVTEAEASAKFKSRARKIVERRQLKYAFDVLLNGYREARWH